MLAKTRCYLLVSTLALVVVPSLGAEQGKPGPAAPKAGQVIHVWARDGGVLPAAIRDRIWSVAGVGQLESFLEGRTPDGVRIVGVEPAPLLHLRAGQELLAAKIVQGRGLEAGDAAEAMVVGRTFAQNNKTALGLSIPAMLTKDHFPPIIIGGQGFAIVGIYTTGDPQSDDQALVLLPTAQRLLNRPGQLSGLYVTPAPPAAADQVAKDLRRALGKAAEVAPLARRQQ